MPKKSRNKPQISKPKSQKKVRGFLFKVSLRTKLLFLVGFLLVIIPTFFYVNEGMQLAFFTPKVIPVQNTFAIPTDIIIPQVNISLPVEETAINHGVWQVASDAISHLTISARPGEKGSIILYGHNTNDRFGPIRWLSPGQTIIVKTKDKSYTYKITETKDVSPNDVSILISGNSQKLILYTCDGFADLQRFVVIAMPRS